MASFKYKSLMKKRLTSKLGTAVSSLQKENAFLKKTLAELCREHSEHNRLVEVNSVTQSCSSYSYTSNMHHFKLT